MKKANLARPFISTRLEQWNYLDRVSNVGVRDRTLQLVLARLLDVEDPELSRALSRLVDLLTLSMVAEEDPLACQEETRVAFEQCKYWWKAPTNSQGQEGSYTSQYILYVILFMSFVQVLRRLLNLGSAGAELWALYQAAETCRHRLSTEVNINSNQHDCMVG